jgi:hypothetical protein
MHSFDARIALRSLTATGVAAFLAACSGGQAVSPAISSANAPYVPTGASTQLRADVLAASGRSIVQSSHSAPGAGTLSPANIPGSHVIYSGNFGANTITIYPMKGTNPAPIGTISTGLSEPERLFVDKNLNLYATNIGTPNAVVAYKPGATSPFLTITNGVDGPTGITVGADGTIYCANTTNNTVTEYPKGKKSPKLTVTLSGETPENMAVDGANNLYIQYLGGSLGSGVLKVPPGQTSGTDLNLVIGSAGALSVDHSGNVVILDAGHSTIDVFPAGQTTPSKTLSIGGFPFELSMTKSEKQVYVSNEVGSPFVIQVADYPNLKSVKTKISSPIGDWPLAVAPDNAL